MKLELKHIAQYLPYGLTVQWCNGEIEDIGVYRVTSAILTNAKPILRPISDLYKEINTIDDLREEYPEVKLVLGALKNVI